MFVLYSRWFMPIAGEDDIWVGNTNNWSHNSIYKWNRISPAITKDVHILSCNWYMAFIWSIHSLWAQCAPGWCHHVSVSMPVTRVCCNHSRPCPSFMGTRYKHWSGYMSNESYILIVHNRQSWILTFLSTEIMDLRN